MQRGTELVLRHGETGASQSSWIRVDTSCGGLLEGSPIGEHVEPPETHPWAGVRFGRSAMTVSRIAC